MALIVTLGGCLREAEPAELSFDGISVILNMSSKEVRGGNMAVLCQVHEGQDNSESKV